MAYIAPNSTIKLFNNVPLDNSYRNTLMFPGVAAQTQYYASASAGIVATLTAQMYQRVNQNTCRVEVPYSSAYSVNYMAFKNESFENKWFYAFVNKVNYINNSVVELEYELDVMQSFMFDVDLKPCLVEREHIAKGNDTVGANIIPERFDVGEYKYSGMRQMMPLTDFCVILGMVDDKSSEYAQNQQSIYDVGIYDATLPQPSEGFYDGVYSGLQYYRFDMPSELSALTAFINSHIKTVDNIYSMYMAPQWICPQADEDHKLDNLAHTLPEQLPSLNGALNPATADFDGYIPMNKKLLTYPYNFFGLTNGQGNGLTLRYEFFESLYPKFDVTYTFVDPVTLVARPILYKGIGSNSLDMCESLTLTGFPLCSWSYDTYSRWVTAKLPQEKRAMTREIVSGAIGAVGSLAAMMVAGPVGGIAAGAVAGAGLMKGANIGTNLINKTANLYEQRYDASIAQDPLKGNSANGNADFAAQYLSFWEYRGHVSGQVAKEIDQYFAVFGYQTNQVKVPNRTGRTYWNYVKTANCTLTKKANGMVSAADISQMEAIYDSGITFWHNAEVVGNYSEQNMRDN